MHAYVHIQLPICLFYFFCPNSVRLTRFDLLYFFFFLFFFTTPDFCFSLVSEVTFCQSFLTRLMTSLRFFNRTLNLRSIRRCRIGRLIFRLLFNYCVMFVFMFIIITNLLVITILPFLQGRGCESQLKRTPSLRRRL